MLEAAACHGQAAEAVGAGLDVADIEQTVGGEGRMQHHVADARLLAPVLRGGAVSEEEDVGEAGHRLLQQDALAHDAQAAGPFGDQHVAVWREGHREGMDEAVHKGFNAEVVQRGTDHGGRCRLARRARADSHEQSRHDEEQASSHERNLDVISCRWQTTWIARARTSRPPTAPASP